MMGEAKIISCSAVPDQIGQYIFDGILLDLFTIVGERLQHF
jgi:hypothetical protein